jgi:hypothetical protein
MSMIYAGSSAWPDFVYCPGHQGYEYHDYGYPHQHWYVYPSLAQYPLVAEGWPGVEMAGNCRYCLRRLDETSDPQVHYCPNCHAFQWHRA